MFAHSEGKCLEFKKVENNSKSFNMFSCNKPWLLCPPHNQQK